MGIRRYFSGRLSVVSEDVGQFKRKLMKLRDELRQIKASGNEAAQIVELDQSRIGRLSRMDAMQAQAMANEVRRRREVQGQRIDSALLRIEKGSYGFCIRCKEAIAQKRLVFDPTSLMCINCAKNIERGK